jgi:hypothetical protein
MLIRAGLSGRHLHDHHQITTVGYKEVHELSAGGRIFSIFLMVVGVGGALYTLTAIWLMSSRGNWEPPWEVTDEKQDCHAERHTSYSAVRKGGAGVRHVFTEELVPFIASTTTTKALQSRGGDIPFLLADAPTDEY